MNYCDYDDLSTYPTGSFSSKYKTEISDCLVEIEKDTSFDEDTVKDEIKHMVWARIGEKVGNLMFVGAHSFSRRSN